MEGSGLPNAPIMSHSIYCDEQMSRCSLHIRYILHSTSYANGIPVSSSASDGLKGEGLQEGVDWLQDQIQAMKT